VVVFQFGPLPFGLASIPPNTLQLTACVGYLTRTPEAITAVREEQSRTEAEREAFEEFAAELEQLDATNDPGPTATAVGSRSLGNGSSAPAATTETVQALYRETVMGVDHYETEYDEPLPTNVAAELGADFRTALLTNDHLTTPLQQALVEKSRVAARSRAEFESLVQSELRSLTGAETRLRSAAGTVAQVRDRDFTRQPIDNFEAGTRQLQAVERECESLIADRQAEYVDAPEEDGLNFREYLYQEYEWTHPAVGDALDLIESVREAETRITAIVSKRL
jgi:hypothetical protein